MTTLTMYVIACDFKKSSIFEKTVEITSQMLYLEWVNVGTSNYFDVQIDADKM